MGWLNKFQAGGQMTADPKIGRIMQQLTSITQKAVKGDAQAMQQIVSIMTDPNSAQLIQIVQQANPQLYDAMVQISDEMNRQEAQAYAKGGKMDYLHMLRCGGKTKKKEDGGEMKEKKSFKLHRISKDAKGGCPCHLKKVGGKIVNVDCEGNIVK